MHPSIPSTDTYAHYASLLEQRLIPFCDEKGIVYIQDFENKDLCSQFTESWRQLRRNRGALLAMTTRRTELERFRRFLRQCVENEWLQKSGAKVDPSSEIERLSYTCRSMIFAPQTVDSPLISGSAGEAEAGSAGEQPAEE